jgi:hypothetical protein
VCETTKEVAMSSVTVILVEDGCGMDSTGDDQHEWYVTPCDDDGEQVEGTTQVTCFSQGATMAAADEMSAMCGGVEVATA